MKKYSPWKGPMLEKFVKDCIPWEGPHARVGEPCQIGGEGHRRVRSGAVLGKIGLVRRWV